MKKTKIIKRVVALVIVIALIGAGFFGFNIYQNMKNRSTQAFAATTGTTVEIARRSDLRETLTATGIIYLKDEEKIYSEGTGTVDKVLVETGDEIKNGQTIITYNNKETLASLERQLTEAQISLNNQQLTLQSMVLPASESELKKLNDAVSTADRGITDAKRSIEDKERAVQDAITAYNITNEKIDNYLVTVDKMKNTVENNEKLLTVGGISQDTYKDSVESYNNALVTLAEYYKTLASNEKSIEDAKRAVEDAKTSLDDAYTTSNNAKKDLADANVVLKDESERINYEKQLNQVKLSEMNISKIQEEIEKLIEESKSNVTGTVTSVNVESKASVTDKTHLITVANFSSLIVKSDISEYDAPNIALGQQVEMTSDGISGMIFIGEITKIGAQAKAGSSGSESTVEVEITIKNPNNKIKPGYSLDLEIIILNRPEVINISISAIQRDRQSNEYYVYTVDENNIIHKTPVTLGVYGDLNVEVVSGLEENSIIVASPDFTMYDGMTITRATGTRPAGGTNANNPQQGGMFNIGGGMMAPSGGNGGNVRRVN